MRDLKLLISTDGSLWISHADDVDAVPHNGFFIYSMEQFLSAVDEVENKDKYRFAKVRVQPVYPFPPTGPRP